MTSRMARDDGQIRGDCRLALTWRGAGDHERLRRSRGSGELEIRANVAIGFGASRPRTSNSYQFLVPVLLRDDPKEPDISKALNLGTLPNCCIEALAKQCSCEAEY